MNSSGEIDLGIKNRKRNKPSRPKKKYVNTLGNTFVVPDQCKKLHNRDRFNCSSLTLEDALAFRAKLYSTDDKITQDKFAAQFVYGEDVKRRRRKPESSAPQHEISVYYTMQRKSGDKINICRNMFIAITGFNKQRAVKVTKQIKNFGEIKETRGGDRRSFDYVGNKIIQLVQKAEDEINQEKAQNLIPEQEFVELPGQIKVENDTDDYSEPPIKLRSSRPPRKKRKIVKEETDDLQDQNQSQQTEENLLVEPKLELLEGDISERCRICLKASEGFDNNLFLFDEYSGNETFADMVEFCLGLKLIANDCLPQFICQDCVQRVQIAHKLKSDSLATEKLLENYTQTCKSRAEKIQENLDKVQVDSKNEVSDEFDGIGDFDMETFYKTEDDVEEEEDLDQLMDSKTAEETQSKVCSKLPTRCYLCDITFDSINSPKLHFEISHNQVGKFQCKYEKCEFEIDNLYYLNLHYQVHADDIRLCPFCGKSFTPQSYPNHRGYCENDDSGRVLCCRYCPRKFAQGYKLKVHEMSHTGQKPFKCNYCDAAYVKKPSLRKHLLSHGAKPEYTCHCGKGFVQMYRLKGHQETCLKNKSFI